MESISNRAGSRETDKAILSSIASELLRITRNLETQTNAEIARFGKTWKYGDAAFALQRDAVQDFARVMRIAAAESLVDATAAKIALNYPDGGNTWINYVGDLETHYRGATEAVTWKPEAIVQALRFVAGKLAAKAIEPMDTTEAAGPVQPAHNGDFTMVNWYGTEYTFSPGLQAGAVKALWQEWEKTGLGLHQESVRECIDAERDNFRLSHVFRGHPAYGVMIHPCGDGKYRLGKSDAKGRPPKKKARTAGKLESHVPNGGLSERARRAKRMIDAEYATAHPDDQKD